MLPRQGPTHRSGTEDARTTIVLRDGKRPIQALSLWSTGEEIVRMDVVVIGAGPAGVVAALRSADLGAKTALIIRDEFGGMAANDGPVPVRTLAHAARLIRQARQLGLYGISVGDPVLDYPRLLARVREVVDDVRAHSAFRAQIDSVRVSVYERAGAARFTDPHTVETESGLRLQADKIIICTGGMSR